MREESWKKERCKKTSSYSKESQKIVTVFTYQKIKYKNILYGYKEHTDNWAKSILGRLEGGINGLAIFHTWKEDSGGSCLIKLIDLEW